MVEQNTDKIQPNIVEGAVVPSSYYRKSGLARLGEISRSVMPSKEAVKKAAGAGALASVIGYGGVVSYQAHQASLSEMAAAHNITLPLPLATLDGSMAKLNLAITELQGSGDSFPNGQLTRRYIFDVENSFSTVPSEWRSQVDSPLQEALSEIPNTTNTNTDIKGNYVLPDTFVPTIDLIQIAEDAIKSQPDYAKASNLESTANINDALSKAIPILGVIGLAALGYRKRITKFARRIWYFF